MEWAKHFLMCAAGAQKAIDDMNKANSSVAMQNQYMSMRRPTENLGIIGRSAYDVDGTAADAVEGRNSTLQFYRTRTPLNPRFSKAE